MPRPRRRTFGQKVKRAAIITGIAGAAAFGTAMAVSPTFRAKVVNVAEDLATRAGGAAAGAGAGYIVASGARGWRKNSASPGVKKAAMIGGGVAGAVSPIVGVGALAVTAVGKENWKKAGRVIRDKYHEVRDKRAETRRNTPRRS